MKASDICVGDWLNIYTFPNDNPKQDDLFPAMVSAVSVFDPFKDPYDVTVELAIFNTNGIVSRPLDTCLPIELTEEILVKNGFEYAYNEVSKMQNKQLLVANIGGHYIEIRLDKKNVAIWYDYDEDGDGVYSDVLLDLPHHVHNFQHLLRLCGIEKEIKL